MTQSFDALPFDAIVLAGGRARRLDGADKPQMLLQGRPLLDHVLDSVADAGTVVVVGPDRLARPGVLTVLEDPPFGGPAAGIAAGLGVLDAGNGPHDEDFHADSAPPVVVLACDIPRSREFVPALLAALASDSQAAGAQMVTPDGRHQPLAAAYRRDAFQAAIASAGSTRDASVHSLLKDMTIVAVADPGHSSRDVDTWEDLESMDQPLEARPMNHDPAGAMTVQEWLAKVGAALEVPIDEVPIDPALDISREIAHAVARPAVPMSMYVLGYAAGLRGSMAGAETDFARISELVAQVTDRDAT